MKIFDHKIEKFKRKNLNILSLKKTKHIYIYIYIYVYVITQQRNIEKDELPSKE